MKLAVVHPGTQWSTSDVFDGLCYGLKAHGVEVVTDQIQAQRPDAIVMVTAIRPERRPLLEALTRSEIPVTVLFTESPYERERELQVVRYVSGCWTHERTFVETLKAVNQNTAYLPHAWHPGIHTPEPRLSDAVLPAHDVVFVGSGFRERVSFFNSIDWTGIDLGLYGIWSDLGLKPQVQACVRSDGPISNEMAAGLYRRAKIGLNLYRRLPVDRLVRDVPENWVQAESLNPRAYELAACGCYQISEHRPEMDDIWGDTVSRFDSGTAGSAEALIRLGLARTEYNRSCLAAFARACVPDCSWVDRAGQVLRDLAAWGVAPDKMLAGAAQT